MNKLLIPGILLIALLIMAFAYQVNVQKARQNHSSGKPTLKIAMSGLYPPFNYRDERNELVGFDVDIARELAQRMGHEPELVTTAWDGILAGLVTKKFDLIIGSMAITDERKKAVNFSDPYYVSGAQLIVLKGSTIKDTGGLRGKVVGATLGETYGDFIKENVPGVTRVATYKGGVPNLLLELKNKRIDAFVSDRLVGLYAIKQAGHTDAVLAGKLLFQEEMGIAVQKDNTELLKDVNRALAQMMADGSYAEISRNWFGRNILETE